MSVVAKHSHVLSLELRSQDAHAESEGTSTTTSAMFQDKVTASFTSATAGDYLIVADAQVKLSDTTTEQVECQLLVDGVAFHKLVVRPRSTDAWLPWSCVLGAITGETLGRLGGSPNVIKIQFRSTDGTITASIRRARIVVLRLDTFKNFYYAEALSRQFEPSASYVTKLTNAPDLVNAGDHLVFAAAHIDGTAGSGRFTAGQITAGGTTMLESIFFPTRSRGDSDSAMFFGRLEDLSAGASATNTWRMQIRKGGTGTGGVGIEHAAICVIELEEAVPVGRIVSLGQTVTRDKIVLVG